MAVKYALPVRSLIMCFSPCYKSDVVNGIRVETNPSLMHELLFHSKTVWRGACVRVCRWRFTERKRTEHDVRKDSKMTPHHSICIFFILVLRNTRCTMKLPNGAKNHLSPWKLPCWQSEVPTVHLWTPHDVALGRVMTEDQYKREAFFNVIHLKPSPSDLIISTTICEANTNTWWQWHLTQSGFGLIGDDTRWSWSWKHLGNGLIICLPAAWTPADDWLPKILTRSLCLCICYSEQEHT